MFWLFKVRGSTDWPQACCIVEAVLGFLLHTGDCAGVLGPDAQRAPAWQVCFVLFDILFTFMVVFAHMCLCVQGLWRPDKGIRASETGCEPPHMCWGQNPGPLQQQSVLLTSTPSLQPLRCFPHMFSLSLWLVLAFS